MVNIASGHSDAALRNAQLVLASAATKTVKATIVERLGLDHPIVVAHMIACMCGDKKLQAMWRGHKVRHQVRMNVHALDVLVAGGVARHENERAHVNAKKPRVRTCHGKATRHPNERGFTTPSVASLQTKRSRQVVGRRRPAGLD